MGRSRNLGPLLIITISILSGCFGSQTNGPTDTQDRGDSTSTFVLGVDQLPSDSNWVILEITPAQTGIFSIRGVGEWEFANAEVDPDLTRACHLLGASDGSNSSFAAPLTFVPGRSEPGALGSVSQGETGIGTLDRRESVQIRTTGTSWSLNNSMAAFGLRGQPLYASFGLSEFDRWLDAGASYRLEISSDNSTFTVRPMHSGNFQCLTGFGDYEEGEFVRSPSTTEARDLGTRAHVETGLVAHVHYSGNLARSVRVVQPDGVVVHANSTQGADLGPNPDQRTICSPQTGDWSVGFPQLRGTDQRWVWAETVIFDVPAALHAAFPCTK